MKPTARSVTKAEIVETWTHCVRSRGEIFHLCVYHMELATTVDQPMPHVHIRD